MIVMRVDRALSHPVEQPELFQGQVRMQPLYRPDRDDGESELVAVFFDAGARTKPHVHDTDQVLQVVSGSCVVVIEEERREVGPGDFVQVPRGAWHWHGSSGAGPACHISIKLPGRTDWGASLRGWESG